ncbi:MAG TPA: site-2 protease family protein [Gammaproteobacteria bacterium]|nr:site-2 protease family protein [Gammaproteobacteria bacterium]
MTLPGDEIQIILVWVIPTLFAITVHEAAHGIAAYYLGDKTAYIIGRMTINPFKHIDPIGTILVPMCLILTGSGIIFGWAKPVPVNDQALHHPKRDMALVAFAGPLSNLIMALIWAGIFKANLALQGGSTVSSSFGLLLMCLAGVKINCILAAINLLPIPPLDGSRMVNVLLSKRLSYFYYQLESVGFIIILGLLLTGILGNIISPIDIYFKTQLSEWLNLPAHTFFLPVNMNYTF